MKNKGFLIKLLQIIILTVLMIGRTTLTFDVAGEYTIVTLPKSILFTEISMGTFVYYTIWLLPNFLVVYLGMQQFIIYFQENYIYFVTRNANIRKTLSFVLKRVVSNIFILTLSSYGIMIILFKQNIDINIYRVFDYLILYLFNMLIILFLLLLYLSFCKEEILAFYFIADLIIILFLTYLDKLVIVKLLLQVAGKEFQYIMIYSITAFIVTTYILRFGKNSKLLN